MVRGLWIYHQFQRVKPTALLTWPARSRNILFMIGLGVLAAGVAVLNGYARRPIPQIYSQGIMAVYFTLMVPLLHRCHPGLYQDGVWAERGFLPYDKIRRMAFLEPGLYAGGRTFREMPPVVLVLVPRSGRGSFRLPVPPEEYGAVRKVLEDKIRSRELNVDAGIL